MNTHERIKKRRKELNLTAEKVAEALNVSRATIYRYESAAIEKLPITIIEPLAKILKTTPAYLMGLDDKAIMSREDKEIVTYYLKNQLDSKIEDLPERFFGLKLLLNEIGYDLSYISNSYYFSDNNGSYIIDEDSLETLLFSTTEYLRFTAFKISEKQKKTIFNKAGDDENGQK